MDRLAAGALPGTLLPAQTAHQPLHRLAAPRNFFYRDLFRFLDYSFAGPLTSLQDYIPDQPPLFQPNDSASEGRPLLTEKEKLLQKRIVMRISNPAPV
jgi:hypothetical protein